MLATAGKLCRRHVATRGLAMRAQEAAPEFGQPAQQQQRAAPMPQPDTDNKTVRMSNSEAFVESLAKFQSSDTLSEGALRALANLIGGKLLGDALGDLAGTSINNLTSDQFASILLGAFDDNGIVMVEAEGEARARVGPPRVCRARVRFFYSPCTGNVLALARCTCCPGLFVFSYRADANGFPTGRVTRRILR